MTPYRTVLATCAATCAAACLSAADPAVAVWDPLEDGVDQRFTLRTGALTTAAGWLAEAGLPVVRLSTQRLREAKDLDPAVHPVLVMSGHLVPLAADKGQRAADLRRFTSYLDAGGVVVGLGHVPGSAFFGTAIDARKGGGWQLSPSEPRFAWEVRELREAVGLRYAYNPIMHDLDVRHEPTALLRRYWPEAPSVKARLPQVHHVGMDAGGRPAEFYALYDSLRVDNQPTVPQVFVARLGRRTAVLANHPGWWGAAPAPWFGEARPLTVALVRLALDLQAGRAVLPASARRELPEEPAGAEPLRARVPEGEVDPDGAEKVVRWGRFDGCGWELGDPVEAGQVADLAGDPARTLPRRLDPGGTIRLPLPERSGSTWLRVRLAYSLSDAALVATADGRTVLAEQFIHVAVNGESNWGGSQLANQAIETMRTVFLPPGPAGRIELTNPGRASVWFDAIQVERHPRPVSPVLVGWYAAANATHPGGAFTVPPGSERFGALRCDARLQHLGPPGDPQRWAKLDALYAQYAAYRAPVHMILFGTPEWMAVPVSLAEARRRNRAHICVPDRARFRQAVDEWLERYGQRFAAIELMNEVDIRQFWIGTFDEYAALCQDVIPLIRARCPGRPILTAGSAAQSTDLLDTLKASGVLGQVDWIANHAYAGQSVAWDLPQGLFEGHCFARGIANPLFANEQGFVWSNCEWFTGPPAWTPARQALATDQAMARLMAGGTARVLVFTAGGDDHGYSYCDREGRPRPGFQVVMDYHQLNGPGAHRCDPQVVPADGGLLRGTYSVASQTADGRITVVLNPCQASLRAPALRLRVPLPDARPRTATLMTDGQGTPVPCERKDSGGIFWAELTVAPAGRTILHLAP